MRMRQSRMCRNAALITLMTLSPFGVRLGFGAEYEVIDLGPGQANDVNNIGVVIGSNDDGPWFWTEREGQTPVHRVFGTSIDRLGPKMTDRNEVTWNAPIDPGCINVNTAALARGFLGSLSEGIQVELRPWRIAVVPIPLEQLSGTFQSRVWPSGSVAVGPERFGLAPEHGCVQSGG